MRITVTVLAVFAFLTEAAAASVLFQQVAGDRRSAQEALNLRGQWDMSPQRALEASALTSVSGFQAVDDLKALRAFLAGWLAGGASRTRLAAWLAAAGASFGLAATMAAIWWR